MNCWDPPKLDSHSVAGNGERDGLKIVGMEQRAISSQAAWRQVEGSTTRAWSLDGVEMVKPHERAAPFAGEDIV